MVTTPEIARLCDGSLTEVKLQVDAASVAELLKKLRTELGPCASAIEQDNVRIAVNQDLIDDVSRPLVGGDEVAFLPPVTGG